MGEPTNGEVSTQTKVHDWVMTIKDELQQHAEQSMHTRPRRKRKIYRVRQSLRQLKPEHYNPDQISLGLIDRFSLSLSKTQADRGRRAVVHAFLGVMGMTIDEMDVLCELVVPDPIEAQDFYDEIGRDDLRPKEVQWALTLDAIFLTCWLAAWCDFSGSRFLANFPTLREAAITVSPVHMLWDLFKVENQIPLSLVRAVLLLLVEKVPQATLETRVGMADKTLTNLCLGFARVGSQYIPGFDFEQPIFDEQSIQRDINFVECEHLLDCLHQVMCHDIEMEYSTKNRRREQDIIVPTVTELQKAGIEFQGLRGNFHEVKLKRRGLLKCTLYIPLLSVGDINEPIWRNIIAYEELEDQPGHLCNQYFTKYLKFMDEMIESKEDVDILKASMGKSPPVICRDGLGDSADIAHIFNNSVLKNSLVSGKDEKYQSHRQEIMDFYNQDKRRLFLDFHQTYFGKPWLTASVVAATILLVATLLQTYYAIASYYKSYG